MPEILMTKRWVATRESATRAAGAFLRLTLRRRQWWLLVAGVEVAFAVLLGLAFDDAGLGTRLVWGSVYALVPTALIAAVGLGVGYLLNRRRFGQRIREGVVLESGFGESSVALKGPWAESTISFDGIASLRRGGDWVFLQQRGSPVVSVWPAELFPADELVRLQGHLSRG